MLARGGCEISRFVHGNRARTAFPSRPGGGRPGRAGDGGDEAILFGSASRGEQILKWKPGQSGNPKGRKSNPIAERFRKATEGQLDAVIEAMLKAAQEGDTSAAKLILERCIPPFKPVAPTTAFKLDGDSLTAKAQAILAAVAAGAIAISDAKQLIDALALLAKVAEFDELERRVAALEVKKRGA